VSENIGINFEDWLAEEMEDEEFRAEYERLGPGFEIAKLRMIRGLTQEELARLANTHQSSIARLESGRRDPSISFLRRVAAAMNAKVEVRIVAQEQQELSSVEVNTFSLAEGIFKPIPVSVSRTQSLYASCSSGEV
jgi:transcriptional regulator with XRE-family HTH domain